MAMMEEFKKHSKRKYSDCSVKIAADQLEEEDHRDLLEALEEPAITGAAIARVLNDRGLEVNGEKFEIKAETINRHRRGGCSCDDEG